MLCACGAGSCWACGGGRLGLAEGQLPGTKVLVGVVGSRSTEKAGVRLEGAPAAKLEGAAAGRGRRAREAGGQGAAQPGVAEEGRQ